jgi:hypothetical protein
VMYLLVLGVLGALLGIANVELQLGPFLHMEGARDIWCMQKMRAETRHGQLGERPNQGRLGDYVVPRGKNPSKGRLWSSRSVKI